MVRGATERDRQAHSVERWQQPVEQRAIFDGELPRQPGVGGVVEVELGLHRGEVRLTRAEGIEGAAKLIALRPVFGIVDHEIFAAGERQGIVQCLRLGAGLKLRDDDDLDIAGEAERMRGRDRRAIGSLYLYNSNVLCYLAPRAKPRYERLCCGHSFIPPVGNA